VSKLDLINGRIKQGGLVQEDKTAELYKNLRKDREIKDSTHKRPLWKRDWKK
jgi:hypothetical protein